MLTHPGLCCCRFTWDIPIFKENRVFNKTRVSFAPFAHFESKKNGSEVQCAASHPAAKKNETPT
jgi:hypothetical protein